MPGEIAMMASIKATEAHIEAIKNTAASKREGAEAVWKAAVLEQLWALNANLASITVNGNAMRVDMFGSIYQGERTIPAAANKASARRLP